MESRVSRPTELLEKHFLSFSSAVAKSSTDKKCQMTKIECRNDH